MNILIVAFYDDNFGDMLIRTCFAQLLKAVLKNLGAGDYSLSYMPLKSLDESRIKTADLIIFPGGGLFGLSYLDFADYVEAVLNIAEERKIPVIFSSLGINNMDATVESEQRLTEMLQKPCIKAVSVREKPDLFRQYAGETDYDITDVCDPVVWAGFIYGDEISAARKNKPDDRPIIGINVVRGGLFKSNGLAWALRNEEEYLYNISQSLEAAGFDYRFFSNGSTLDCNVIRHFAEKYSVPIEKIILTDTSRELVQTIAGFDAVLAIRMHSSIISYALGVPSVNLVWNSKVPEFYSKIGHPERALSVENWTTENLTETAKELVSEDNYSPDSELLMTLYRFLYRELRSFFPNSAEAREEYDFESVREQLGKMTVERGEDDVDLRIKVRKGEARYVSLFTSDLSRKAEMRNLRAELKSTKAEVKSAKSEIKQLSDEKKKLAGEKKALADKLKKEEKQRAKLQKELDRINSMLPVRVYRRIQRVFKRKKK